jgi:glycosyltransferase involved in cell wall biosynthesis
VDPEIHPSPLYFNRAMPRILVVGTTAHKNIERYAAALADVPSHLVIVGALNDSQTRALARRNRPYENLVSLSREEIRRQYALCDLVLFASTYEGFGLPIVEAQAAGRPVVTSNIPPMSDVAGDGACLVDPLDVDSLRQGVFRVVNDDSYRARLIEAGKKNVRRFEADVIAHHYCRLYKYIASKGDAGHKTGAE